MTGGESTVRRPSKEVTMYELNGLYPREQEGRESCRNVFNIGMPSSMSWTATRLNIFKE